MVGRPTLLLLVATVLAAGCASVPPRVTTYKPPVPPEGIVLVANGAGGSTSATRAIALAADKSGTPLYVRTFDWTHGTGRGVADLTDVENAREQGDRMAQYVLAIKRARPNTPVYIVGYSAGTHVALEAARSLPPDSIERMFLFASAVSSDYDLGPALAASRQGVEAYYSDRDRLYLRLGTDLLGTADGQRNVPAAGRVGFELPPSLDPALTRKLHQHAWNANLAWTYNDGAHDGWLSTRYLRTYVLPLMSSP